MKHTSFLFISTLLLIMFTLFACKKERDNIYPDNKGPNTNDPNYPPKNEPGPLPQNTEFHADSMRIAYRGGFSPQPPKGYFMITKTIVKEDNTSTFTEEPDNFDLILSDAKHAQVVYLLNAVPDTLLHENNAYYKDPITADCGTIRIRAYAGNNTYNWIVEDCVNGLPDHVKPFAIQVRNVVQILMQ